MISNLYRQQNWGQTGPGQMVHQNTPFVVRRMKNKAQEKKGKGKGAGDSTSRPRDWQPVPGIVTNY